MTSGARLFLPTSLSKGRLVGQGRLAHADRIDAAGYYHALNVQLGGDEHHVERHGCIHVVYHLSVRPHILRPEIRKRRSPCQTCRLPLRHGAQLRS